MLGQVSGRGRELDEVIKSLEIFFLEKQFTEKEE